MLYIARIVMMRRIDWNDKKEHLLMQEVLRPCNLKSRLLMLLIFLVSAGNLYLVNLGY